jgi:hypothetical protein
MDNQSSSGVDAHSSGNTVPTELEQMMVQAIAIGPNTGEYMGKLINSSQFKDSMLGACRGIFRLARLCGHDRIEAACSRGLQGSRYNLKVIKTILDKNLENQPLHTPVVLSPDTREHENLRGDQFFK